MSKADSAVAVPTGFIEADLLSSIWSIIAGSQAELMLFGVAMVAYFVLFMQRTPKNPKLQTKKIKVIEKEFQDSRTDKLAAANAVEKSAAGRATTHSSTGASSEIAKHITMIRNCAAERNLQGSFSAFESLEQTGADLNCVVFNTVLDACVECKDLKAAENWMDRMKQAGMIDVVSFNTLIKAHLQNGNFGKARQLIENMRVEGLHPNQVTFNEIINAMVSKGGDGRRQQMWDIVEEMKVAEVKPNQVTISILLKNLNAWSSHADILKTMDLIKTMDEPMDEVLLSSVVEACVRIGKPDLLEAQLKYFQDSTPIAINGSHTYGSLIKAYGHAKDLPGCWRCWKEMRSRHIKPTSITTGCMIEAIANNGDTEGAYDLIHQMQDDEHCQSVLNSVIFCSVLKGFTRERNIVRALEVYEEMKRLNMDLSIVMYNTLIDACGRCGRMDHLSTILEDMKMNGTTPNVITYSTMLKGHCQNGDVQSGFKILEQIRKDPHLKPDEIMYNSLLDGCAQNHLVDEGLRLLDEMQAEQVWPSNYTLSIVVKLMNRSRRLDQAFKLVEDITKTYNFRPNVHVYTNLIQACVNNQQLPRGVNMLEQMIADKVAPDGRTYAILVRSSMSRGLCEQAADLLKGALGLPDAPLFLQKPAAACPSLDFGFVNEVLANLADRGHAKDLAVPLLHNIRHHAPKVRIDATTQRKVMSPCVDSAGSGSGRGQGKGKGY